MRTALILAFAAAFAATSVACAVESADSSSSLSRKPKKSSKASSSSTDDEEETAADHPASVGEDDVDPGNPSADTAAPPPTGTGTAAQGFALDVDNKTPTIDLASSSTLNVTVTPKNGFTGTVTITVEGLPQGVTAAPASGAPGSPIAVKLTSSTSTPVTPKDGAVALTIKGTAGTQTATAPANFKVLPKITMTIPTNSAALLAAGGGTKFTDEWGGESFGPSATPLLTQSNNPIVVLVKNEDSTPRTIHGPGGTNGFAHGAGNVAPGEFEMQNGAPRQRTFTPGANTSGYLHGPANGQAVSFHLKVSTAP